MDVRTLFDETDAGLALRLHVQPGAGRNHHGPEREVHRLERDRLQHLAPEIRVYSERLPAHCEGRRVREPVEAVDEGDLER